MKEKKNYRIVLIEGQVYTSYNRMNFARMFVDKLQEWQAPDYEGKPGLTITNVRLKYQQSAN